MKKSSDIYADRETAPLKTIWPGTVQSDKAEKGGGVIAHKNTVRGRDFISYGFRKTAVGCVDPLTDALPFHASLGGRGLKRNLREHAEWPLTIREVKIR